MGEDTRQHRDTPAPPEKTRIAGTAGAGFKEVTRAQQEMWSRGDFHRIGVSQVVVGELLARTLHIHAGERVLDVAGGAGNTALAAARRWAQVTCTDYVPELLERAQERAWVEGLPMQTQAADAQLSPIQTAVSMS